MGHTHPALKPRTPARIENPSPGTKPLSRQWRLWLVVGADQIGVIL